MTPRRVPIALTIAGSDSSGGAGIQADLKTFTVLGVYGASVVTALTAQNTRGVFGVVSAPPAFTRQQIDVVASDLAVSAVKTGMLGDAATVRAVVEGLVANGLRPLVVDPVMVATSGASLLADDAVAAVRGLLLPLADVVTPNLPEAARLLDCAPARDAAEMEAQARALLALGPRWVLIKGGHGKGETALDVLAGADRETGARGDGTATTVLRLERPRVASRNTHGTGCTLSAAITAGLATGLSVPEAVARAKDFVWRAIAAGADQVIGGGHGPVDHLHGVRGA